METNQPETPGRLARVELSLTVGLVATLVAFALAAAYQFLENYRSAIVFLAAALGGAATVTSAYYAAKSLAATTVQNAESIERKRILTAFEYMQRWNDPAFGKTKLRWRLILAELRGRSGEEMSAVLRADPHKRSVVQDVLNHFEELALAVRRGIVDEAVLKDYFRFVVIDYFSVFEDWVRKLRAEARNPAGYAELEWLRDRWGKA